MWSSIVPGAVASVIGAALLWLVVRVKKYGTGFWVNHRLKIALDVAKEAAKEAAAARELVEQKQQELQTVADKVLKTLTETNGGESVRDYLNVLKIQAAKMEELLNGHTVRVTTALDAQTADVKNMLDTHVTKTELALVDVVSGVEKFQNEVKDQLGGVNALMITLTNRVAALQDASIERRKAA